ncbi:MAG: EF-Tu/IF-2/RF-3 family GTPase, partial [Alphaproteobacteria bacterium]|nr:EF-Tu/IF-2/RF-3 family GTPase [Alphaproteobacteria bacterium]
KAVPSTPVEVLGLQTAPTAGDDFVVVLSEEKARQVAAYRQQKAREALMVKSAKAVGMSLFDKIKAGEVQAVPVIVKGDVQGSVEALNGILGKLATDKVKVRVVHSAIGAINESDVMLAGASGALIIGFNVRASTQAREKARQMGVEIRYYSVVYNVVEDLKDIMAGKLEPELREKFIGYAQVQALFSIPKIGKIAGCMVTDGVVKRGAGVRLLRDDVVIYEGKLKSLQRMKDEVKEVKQGFDCGIGLENFEDIKVGDVIECFEMEAIAVKIDVPNV